MEEVMFELHHEGRVRVCQTNKKGNNILGRENTAFKTQKGKELNIFCVQWKVKKFCNMWRGYKGKLLKHYSKDNSPIKSF